MPVCDSGPVLLCDISTGVARPIVPETHRRQVFNVIHNLAHPGRKTTQKLISEKFVWHGPKKRGEPICERMHSLPDTKNPNTYACPHR